MIIIVESPYKNSIEEVLRENGIKTKGKPDFIISYGGDGTILKAEYNYPGVLKIPIRESHKCSMCIGNPDILPTLIEKLKSGKYGIKEFEKVEATFGSKKLAALNEIQIHNKDPRKAVRLSLQADGKVFEEIIGDGLLFSTAYGSSGYYSSLGYKKFDKGIRVALNNPHNTKSKPIEIKSANVRVLREIALLIADNQDEMIEVVPGDFIEIRKSEQTAKFVVLK